MVRLQQIFRNLNFLPRKFHANVFFCLILFLYALLLIPTLSRQGISWDEQNDLWIAQSYLHPGGFSTGSPLDPSQTRLPMAVTALFYLLLGTDDLITARAVSVLVGGLTLLGVFNYGRQRFSPTLGLLASGILAISPFFLTFARVAFTETDIYLACAFIWLLVGFQRWQAKPTWGNAILTGALFGLCLSAKFTAIFAFPAVVLEMWLTKPAPGQSGAPDRLAASILAALTAVLVFFLSPLEHYTNPHILESLLGRSQQEMDFSLAFMAEAAVLHVLCLLLKSSPLLGVGFLSGWVASVRYICKPFLRFAWLLTIFYSAGLLILPIAQTFYTIPLLPILVIFAADLFLCLLGKHRRLALGLAAAAILWWLVDLALCYPDYNLNGYQYLGARPLAGVSTIGYRSVAQTPSDGTQQIFEWLNANAQPGERVLACVIDWHIVQATAPKPAYNIENAFTTSLYRQPDYFVEQINAVIWQGWGHDTPKGSIWRRPYNRAWLESHYEKVFSVQRAFGIEMASVWKLKHE